MDNLERSVKEGFARIERILQGDLTDPDSRGGLAGEIRANKAQLADHERRLTVVEESAKRSADWIDDRNAQWRLLLLLGGGDLLGLLYVLYLLAQHVGGK
jgi:hypothetical protein